MSRPSPPHLTHRLRTLVTTSPPSTALFYARLWLALVHSPIFAREPTATAHDAVHALALAFLAAGEPYSALYLVADSAEGSRSQAAGSGATRRQGGAAQGCLGCAMLVARACEAVGRYTEGARVLERAIQRAGASDPNLPTLQPNSAGGPSLLLARISQRANNPDLAAEHYAKALQADPWLWEAFVGLCDLGRAPIMPEYIFPSPQPLPQHQPSAAAGPSRQASTATLRGGTMLAPSQASPFPPAASMPMPRSSASEVPSLFGGAPRKAMTAAAAPPPLLSGDLSDRGLFTPDAPMLGGGGGGRGAARPMMGGMMWDTPSSVGDNTFPTIDVPRRHLPFRPGAAPTHTPATTVEAAPSRPPAMKRPRGTTRPALETPVTSGMSAHVRAPSSDTDLRRGQRDLKSIEPNGDADLPPRRSSRLKASTKPVRTKPIGLAVGGMGLDRDRRVGAGVGAGALSRSRSATATSSASGMTDLLSPPLPSSSLDPSSASSSAAAEAHLQAIADEYLLSLIRPLALATRDLASYATRACVTALDALPPFMASSALTLDLVSRAWYEAADYARAQRAYAALYALEPYRLHGAHLYSTLLWHTADAPGLSALAQRLMGISRERGETWIALGNAFSMAGEREVALRCFRRGAAVGESRATGGGGGAAAGAGAGGGGGTEPGYETRVTAYAYTLCGYEAVEMDESERAVGYYRMAIRTDARLYNAWYGMGQVYHKLSKWRHAEHHFRRAAEINSSNPVLMCCIGSVLEMLSDNRQALEVYEAAARLAPDNAMVSFRRVRMLVALGETQRALDLLGPLARTAPDEAQVQLLLGKCLLRAGRRAEGVQALSDARELAPRLTGVVRGLMERDGEDGEDSEVEDE